jgi:hypothetical protein
MNALDLILKRRNAANDGVEEILVPVAKYQQLGFGRLKEPTVTAVGRNASATALATAGAGTYTAAALLSGVIARDPTGAARDDTTDTAAAILAAAIAVGLLVNDYDEIFCVVKNTADAAETITVLGGVGVTLQSAITVAQASCTKLAFTRMSAALLVCREV